MPVSGLVISLSENHQWRQAAIDAIGDEPRIEIGVIESGRMSVVMDTADSEEDKQLWNWLSSLGGVIHLDVAMIGFEDDEPENGRQSIPP